MTISNGTTAYFRVHWDNGHHDNEVENFETKEEAVKRFMSEVEKFKANPGEYTNENPEEWNETDYYPTITVDYVDEDDSDNDCDINDFDLNRGFFQEFQS